MRSAEADYTDEDVVRFLKEEYERIITLYPFQREGSVLSEAQAFEIWLLHQEMGIDYGEAAKHILDGPNDGGVDFIWTDTPNSQVVIGQAQYEVDWTKSPASKTKAIQTFSKFKEYLKTASLPTDLAEISKPLWREAKQKISSGHGSRYVYATPKSFSATQEDSIRSQTGITNFDFITHDMLLERGREFLDGQTGMLSFDLRFNREILNIPQNFGSLHIGTVPARRIHEIVDHHERTKRLRALFASNIRTFLTTKKRSKEIADSMKETLLKSPREFLVRNNGITIQCTSAKPKGDHTLFLERASISNGCQTAMNVHTFFKDHDDSDPTAEVLVTLVELNKEASRLAGDIAQSRNSQNPVEARDLMANNFRLVCLHHRLLADRVAGSERRYYLLRKAGEKQTLLREEPEAKGRYVWIDAADLAQCIAAVIRQDPYIAQQGASNLFGRYFEKVFPDVSDPSHSRCKYSWWLNNLISNSYTRLSKWKGVKDEQIHYDRDFKNPAFWVVAALIAKELGEKFNFDDNFEQRFVSKAEKWWVRSTSLESQEFSEFVYNLVEDAYLLIHSICRRLIGRKLPKGGEIYTTYDALLRTQYVYPLLSSAIRRHQSKTYYSRFYESMRKLHEYLKLN